MPETRPALHYVAQTIEETMRIYPAAPVLISRRAMKPVTLGAWQFPARTLFMLPLQLMHHEPQWSSDPGSQPLCLAVSATGSP